MGCASSKQHKRCHHCQKRSLSPVRRSYSMNVAAQLKKDNNYHVVALKSSTVGSLKLDLSSEANPPIGDGYDVLAINGDNLDKLFGDKLNGNWKLDDAGADEEEEKTEFPAGVMEAKIWSKMIEEKIPKIIPITPTRTPPGEPETINTWELMEGLEEVISPFRSPRHRKSLSLSVTTEIDDQSPESKIQAHSPRPMWLQMEDGDRVPSFTVPEFDPDVIATFRESLQEQENRGETKPKNDAAFEPKPDFSVPELISALKNSLDEEEIRKEKESAFEEELKRKSFHFYPKKGGKERVVLYFTSLRGVRKTYEDCCHVRVILKGIGVRVDERDVSMHSGFRDELRELMIGEKSTAAGVLPAVFIGTEFIGGAEEIRQMHEEGQVEKLLEGCERAEIGGGIGGGACETCGDVRFVPCETCNGSCKVYYDYDDDEEEGLEEEMDEFGFQRCPDCNENGLIRCPICCD